MVSIQAILFRIIFFTAIIDTRLAFLMRVVALGSTFFLQWTRP
jgi:hypothetical protein